MASSDDGFFEEPASTFEDDNTNDGFLLATWVLFLCIFLSLPFCSSRKRRQLWRQRLRERRWIRDDDEDDDDWYRIAFARRQAERRQQMEAEQQRFQTTKTQEDEIREQYLRILLEKYSLKLSNSDIHELSKDLRRSSSHGSLGANSVGEQGGGKGSAISDTDDTATPSSDSSNHIVAFDIESPPAPSSSTRARSNSVVSNENDDDALLEMNFDGMSNVVYVPLPGEPISTSTSTSSSERTTSTGDETKEQPRPYRQVPSGCAICLAQFLVDEKITWASNGDCSHVFHHECLVHWFLAVGRKARKKQLRQRPDMDAVEDLDLLCKFPKLCPCCRQTFCVEKEEEQEVKDHEAEDGGNYHQLAVTNSSTTRTVEETTEAEQGETSS